MKITANILAVALTLGLTTATLSPASSNTKGKYPKSPSCSPAKTSKAIQAAECSHNTRTSKTQTFAVFKVDHQYDANHGAPYGTCVAYTCTAPTDDQLSSDSDYWTFFWNGNGESKGEGAGCIKDPQTGVCGCENSNGQFISGSSSCKSCLWTNNEIIVLQDLIPGRPLSVWNSSISRESRHTFLDALAQFLFDLWSTDAPESVNASTGVINYAQWLEDKIDNGIRRCINGTGRWGKASDYFVMRSLIPHYTQGTDDITKIGIAHGDMNAYNFMVNEEYELTGVLDWDWSFEAPMPAVVHFPWFLADIPGWHDDGTIAGDDFDEDRRYLVQAFRNEEKSTSADSTLSSLLDGARSRQRFQSAINYRDIHLEYVKSDKVFQEAKLKDLRPTLETFLVKHSQFHEWVAKFQQDM